jgi:peptidoglycan-associated lipoprotein
MKKNHFLHCLIAAYILGLSACASNVKLDDLPPVDANTAGNDHAGVLSSTSGQNNAIKTNPTNTLGTGNANSTAITTVQTDVNTVTQPTDGMLAKRNIYFDYDSFVIRDDIKPVLQAHAKNLNTHRNQKVALEGHTDERGGREYNLALGQKRAIAVQKALQLLGVTEAQLESVSFGKEKPKALGNTEKDHAENRRVDIEYK